MRTTIERELKLDAPPGFELPRLRGTALPDRLFISTYYDTPSRSLGRAGITLRRRVEDRRAAWQLKLPRGGSARAEIEARGTALAPPAKLAALLSSHLRRGALEQVAMLRTTRRGTRVTERRRAIADVTLDEVEILEADVPVGGFVEIEIELVDGDEADLARLGRELRKAGARRSDGRAKVMRVMELDEDAEPSPRAATHRLLAYQLRRQLLQLEAHDPGVRLGDDPEDVHRFRVATRRSRALIRATKPLVGDRLAVVASELGWLAGVLGPVRDLDVLIEHLRSEVATLEPDERGGESLVSALESERALRRTALLEALDSDRYVQLLDTYAAAIAALPQTRRPLQPLAAAELRRFEKAARGIDEASPDAELHALRIQAKRARYAAELAALRGGKRLARYVEAVTAVQDVLGEHQDAVVAEERLRALGSPSNGVAVGRLIERERARRLAARLETPAAIAVALAAGRTALS